VDEGGTREAALQDRERIATADAPGTPVQAGRVARVHLDIARAREPIQGSLGIVGNKARPFHGWLELAAALEAVRDGRT
jgi:hypothetical protein